MTAARESVGRLLRCVDASEHFHVRLRLRLACVRRVGSHAILATEARNCDHWQWW